jgi:phosphopentomutase
MIISEMTTKEWAHRNAVEYYEQREEEQDEEIARLSARLKVLQDAQIAAVTQDHRNLFKYEL